METSCSLCVCENASLMYCAFLSENMQVQEVGAPYICKIVLDTAMMSGFQK